MKAVNEGSMLVAKSLDILKGYKKAIDEHEIWEIVPVEEAISILELALEKLVADIN
jgi:hypothetical protein